MKKIATTVEKKVQNWVKMDPPDLALDNEGFKFLGLAMLVNPPSYSNTGPGFTIDDNFFILLLI